MSSPDLNLKDALTKVVKGEVTADEGARREAARDTSLFERMPELVVYPQDAADVSADVALAARAAGTDMTGGPLTTGVVLSFTKHMNRIIQVADGSEQMVGYAITEPGVFYRDFERATLEKGLILPSYPASRGICAMGGIVANNSGGERTLEYGQT